MDGLINLMGVAGIEPYSSEIHSISLKAIIGMVYRIECNEA